MDKDTRQICADLCKMIRKFKKEHKEEISDKDMANVLHYMFQEYADDRTVAERSADAKTIQEFIDKKDIDDFVDMWNGFVQQSIDYINTHDNVKNAIYSKRDSIKEMWDKNTRSVSIYPDISLNFSVDGLEDSIKEGKWTPATDSYISINVANDRIIEML